MEASFFVTDDALRRITPNMQQFDESGILSAFDLNRNLIHAIAAKVYGRGRKGSYELVAADFLTYDSRMSESNAVGKRM